jgi:hypothetical protein
VVVRPGPSPGPCSALLQKAARFARLYPSAADLAALGRLHVGWTRACLALVIGDRKERRQMLCKARREGWTGQGLRFEVQRLYPSGQREPTAGPSATRRPTGAT